MHDPSLVAMLDALEELVEDGFVVRSLHRFSQFVEVFLHILVEVLENEEEPVLILAVHDLVKVNDMRVLLELLQNCNFSDSC